MHIEPNGITTDDIDVWIDDGRTATFGNIRTTDPAPMCMVCHRPLWRFSEPSIGPDAVVYACRDARHMSFGVR